MRKLQNEDRVWRQFCAMPGRCGEVADVDSVKGLKERPESKLIAPSFVHDFSLLLLTYFSINEYI